MGYVLTISLERYQMAKKKKKTERAEETIVCIPPPPQKKITNSIVELRVLTERFLS